MAYLSTIARLSCLSGGLCLMLAIFSNLNAAPSGSRRLIIGENPCDSRSRTKTAESKPEPSDVCPRPELLQADLVTDSTARLTWSDVGDKYEIELAAGADPFTGTPTYVVNADPPFDIAGLTPGRNYRFQVRTLCADTTSSVWSAPRSFTTDLNNARPCPLNFDLRDTSCGNTQVFRLHVDDAPGISLGSDVQLYGVRMMVEHPWRSDLSIWLVGPDGARIQLIGGLNAGDQNIGDPQGAVCAQFVELTDDTTAAQPLSAAAEKDNFTGYFLPVEALAGLHTGQNPVGVWQVEFCDNKAAHKGKLRLFELVFARMDCTPVQSVSAANVTENSADIFWTPDALGDSLLIEYGPAGFIPGAGGQAGTGSTAVRILQPAATPYHLTGLQTLQWYEVYLRRLCAPGLWSPNSTYAKLFTNCPATLLETVDTLPVCSTGCPDPCPLPGIWQNVPGDDYEWKVYSGPGLAWPVAGPPAAPGGSGNYLYFRNACSPTGAFGKTAILRSLCIDVAAPPAQVCHFSFDLYMNTRLGQMSTLALQASTDGGQSWTTVQSWSGNRGKLWRREYVNLGAFDGQITLFQFVATGTFGAYGDMAMDNLAFYGSQEAGTPDYIFYQDADNDQYGNPDVRVISCFPVAPPGYVAVDSDCNDANPAVYPGAPEILCNQLDENCNGIADDTLIAAPAAPADLEICRGSPAVLSAPGAALGQFFWFDQASGGMLAGTGNTLTLNNLKNTRTYYLIDSLTGPGGGCKSAAVPVTVTVRPTPVLTLAGMPSVCAGNTLDLASLPLIDTANTGGVLSFHGNTPPTPANQLPSTIVEPGFTTTYYALSTTGFGCKGAKAVTVNVLPSPEVMINPGDSVSVCRGRSLQIQAVEAGVGVPPIVFAWSNGLNFPNIPVQAGNTPSITNTYTVTATDANGCTGTGQIRVHTLNNVTQTAILSIQNVTTCGGNDGSISLDPLNGTPPYNFAWAGGALTSIADAGTITGLSQGSYRITVTDATNAGCSMVMPQIVLNAPGLDVSLDTIIHPACPDALTGSIVLNVTGQNPEFHWNNQQTGSTASFLGAGVYSVTITDGNCSQVLSSLEVVSPLPIEIIRNALEHALCQGDSNGRIELAVFGATPPYGYLWNNGANTANIQNLPAGPYQCTITDAHGCTFQSAVETVTQPGLLSVQPDTTVVPARCFGEKTGFLRVKATGGVPPYQYHWANGATTASLGAVFAGVYAVTATDANGCTAVWLGVVPQPAPLKIDSTRIVNPTCVGPSDGSVELFMSGGKPPYHFTWNNDGDVAKIQNLGVGQYYATVTDANGCTLLSPHIPLEAPQLLNITLDSLVNVSCRGQLTGLIAVHVTGAEGALTVKWNGIPDDLTLSNAAAGVYILQVSDGRACSVRDTFTIIQPDAAVAVVDPVVKNALCAGEPTGSVTVRVNGGTLPYQYHWSNGATTQNLPAVPAGTYRLTVTDGKGCTAVSALITVGQPPVLLASATVQDIPCFGATTGDIQLTVSGGIPPYHYIWNSGDSTKNIFNLPAGDYEVTVLDATGCAQVLTELSVIDRAVNFTIQPLLVQPVSCSGAADGKIAVQVMNGTAPYQFSWSPPVGLHPNLSTAVDTASGLSGGDYWVTVTDAAGCSISAPVMNIEEAPPLQLSITQIVDIICKGDSTGKITVDVSGGVPPYIYLWSDGAAQDSLENLPAGTYHLTVTDVRGCSAESAAATVHEPAYALSIVLDQLQPDQCGTHEGSVALHVAGGVPPNTYLWSNGAITASISNLASGTYQLTVTDNLGCTLVSPLYELEQQVALPLGLAGVQIVDVLCFGDSTGAVVPGFTGGTPPYFYAWNNGQTDPVLLNIPAGDYVLTVSDAAGCFGFWPFAVDAPLAPVNATWTVDSTVNGWSIALNPAGGEPPFDIRWDAKSGHQTGPVATSLAAGQYSVTITDANGCELALSIPVGTFVGTVSQTWIAHAVLAPNPGGGFTRLLVDLEVPQAIRIGIYSGVGQLLQSIECPEQATGHAVQLDLRGWPPGAYWVVLRLPNGQQKTLRLIHTGKG